MIKGSEVKCVVCGRTKTFESEGRIIDGSWVDDRKVKPEYWGKWVCGWVCYIQTFWIR